MTAGEFRKLALALPRAVESSHVSHPDFRVVGKVFASLGVPDASWGMVRLTPEDQRSFIGRAPAVFQPCSGAWGWRGYTNVFLEAATKTVARPALQPATGSPSLYSACSLFNSP